MSQYWFPGYKLDLKIYLLFFKADLLLKDFIMKHVWLPDSWLVFCDFSEKTTVVNYIVQSF